MTKQEAVDELVVSVKVALAYLRAAGNFDENTARAEGRLREALERVEAI
jgi:hypothetical protein